MVSLEEHKDFTKEKIRKRHSVQFEDKPPVSENDSSTTSRSKEPKMKKHKNSNLNSSVANNTQINNQLECLSSKLMESKGQIETNSVKKPNFKRKRPHNEPNTETLRKGSAKVSNMHETEESDLNIIKNNNLLEKIEEGEVLNCTLDEEMEKVSSKSSVSKKSSANFAKKSTAKSMATTTKDLEEKYSVLKNEQLIERFMAVSLTNNQKGRIRQILRDLLKGTSDANLPVVIHSQIQTILKSKTDLNDTDLRKIRLLYNMLKTAIKAEEKSLDSKSKSCDENQVQKSIKKVNPKVKANLDEILDSTENEIEGKNKEKKGDEKNNKNKEQKVKGPKRYVVFVGNLPKVVTKEQIMGHFSDVSDDIASVRIPPPKEDKKSAIAYVELKTESSYEMALSKHHTMFSNRRINVLYTTQKDSKISKAEAKAKTSKLVAMVKSGQLRGSIPLKNKRSQRRKRQREAAKAMESRTE